MASVLLSPLRQRMKKYLWFFVLTGALVALIALLRATGNPTLVITNALAVPMRVAIVNDIGESYGPAVIAANGSVAIDVKGGDQLLWLVATYPDGRTMESNRLYVTVGIDVSAQITAQGMAISDVQQD